MLYEVITNDELAIRAHIHAMRAFRLRNEIEQPLFHRLVNGNQVITVDLLHLAGLDQFSYNFV